MTDELGFTPAGRQLWDYLLPRMSAFDAGFVSGAIRSLEQAIFEGPPVNDLPGPHGQVRLLISVYDRERGWLTTKRSIIYGGRHGEPPMIDDPNDEIAVLELRNGLRAIRERWRKP